MIIQWRSGAHQIMTFLGVVVTAVALVMVSSTVAWAGRPEIIKATEHISRSESEPADAVGNDCDGDGINDYSLEMEGKTISKIWPDGEVQVHAIWEGTAWREGGERVRVHHAFTLAFGSDGSFKAVGLPFGLFGDPGGPLVMDAGLLRIDEKGFFVAGPHELLERYALDPNAATCDALGL